MTVRRRVLRVVTVEQTAFLAALGTGLALMLLRGWGPGQARWFGLKLGLVAFLLVPLEAMHAWVAQWWIRPGLREGPGSRALERGIGMDEMLRALALPLLALAVPLLLWLSLARPF